MYNRFEKGLQPRQSVTDYLMAVKEETQQLEEELEALEEVRHTFLTIAAPWKPVRTQDMWNAATQTFVFLASG